MAVKTESKTSLCIKAILNKLNNHVTIECTINTTCYINVKLALLLTKDNWYPQVSLSFHTVPECAMKRTIIRDVNSKYSAIHLVAHIRWQ